MTSIHRTVRATLARLSRDRSGVALIEFAFAAPILLMVTLTASELTNYAVTKMRVSQIALHIADHAARMGEGSPLQAKQISETQINDMFTGAGLQAGKLDLYDRGRVILSSLEPKDNPNSGGLYKITWQRCRGSAAGNSSYGRAGDTDLAGMGRAGHLVTAPDGGATIFAEVQYRYRPIIDVGLVTSLDMKEIAAMPVRDRRDTTQVYNNEGATASTC
jgi:hypothetical protein